MSIIARVLSESYNLSLSAAYHHCSDNRESYDYYAKKIRESERQKVKQRIYDRIHNEGVNTGLIAKEWNMPLEMVNKIYCN